MQMVHRRGAGVCEELAGEVADEEGGDVVGDECIWFAVAASSRAFLLTVSCTD